MRIVLATAAAIANVELPAGAGPDSVNLVPALIDADPPSAVRKHTVHLSLHGVFAIRQGAWKLIPKHRGSGGFSQPRDLDPEVEGGPPGQLYHLENDPAETKNLFEEEPEVVQRLTRLLERIRDQQ